MLLLSVKCIWLENRRRSKDSALRSEWAIEWLRSCTSADRNKQFSSRVTEAKAPAMNMSQMKSVVS